MQNIKIKEKLSNVLINLKIEKFQIIALIIWLLVAVNYLFHTPIGHRNHDFWGHIEYSQIIAKEHRIPTPYEKWQAFQPPLYYLICSVIAPASLLQEDKTIHIRLVQLMSVFFGLITVWIISWFLQKSNNKFSSFSKFITLLFVVLTPKFVFIFSTYNNDSLVTFLIIASIALTYSLYNNWSWEKAFLLFIVSTAAAYTKFSSLTAILAIIIVLCRSLLNLRLPNNNEMKIIITLLVSLVFLCPWLILHNQKLTGKLFPNNAENGLGEFLTVNDDRSLDKVFFRIPFFQQDLHEWEDPWAYGHTHIENKKHDYLGFSFITSIYGETIFETPSIITVWILVWIHLIFYLAGLKYVFKTNITKLSGMIILMSHFGQAVYIFLSKSPPACTMDFRYIAWSLLGWSVLYKEAISSSISFLSSILLTRLMLVGIIIQIYFLVTCTGNNF